ncbi:MAG: tyrosine-type recombinase/integrase [Pseudomonadota bacterium]
MERSPDEIFDESYAQKREEFVQIAGPLKEIINSPNLRPEARALLDERLPSWMNTPKEISNLLQSSLPAHVIRDNLEDWKALAFSNQPVERTHRQLWQAQLDVLTAQIDALKPDTVTVQKLLEQMIEFKKLKGSTPRKYRSHIDELVKDLGGDLPVKQINRQQLRDQRDRLISNGLTPATVHAHFTAIKSVFSFAVEEELIDTSPADRIRLPKDSRPIELSKWLPFTPTEMERILRGVDELWGKPLAGMPKERRVAFRTLIRVLSFTCLRPEELVRLEPEDVSSDWIKVPLGKTESTPRVVPLHPEISDYPEWLTSGGMNTFVNRRTGRPLTVAGKTSLLRQNFSKLIRARIDPPIVEDRKVLYSLRATFQNAMRRAGAPEQLRQAILGHSEGGKLRHYSDGPEFDLKRDWVVRSDPRR